MEIEFDPKKDRGNVANHGLSLAVAGDLEWDLALSWEDTRFEYSERRFNALVSIGADLFFVTYTQRAHARRIISLRKANRRERNRHARETQDPRSDP